MIKLCVFDLDGTTAFTLKTIAYYGNLILKKHNLPELPVISYRKLIGGGALALFRNISALPGYSDIPTQDMAEEWTSLYSSDPCYLTDAYPGITEMLKSLNAANIKCAVLTNKPEVLASKITASLFGDLLARTVGAKAGRPLKPDTTVLRALMSEFGTEPYECLYVGDSGIDMKTGSSAGCVTIGVNWGFGDVPDLQASGADAVISEACQIAEMAKDAGLLRKIKQKKDKNMKKLICFDLDGTLTQHRSPLEKENRELLDALGKKYKLIMVGAGNCPRIYGQMGEYPIDIVGNYGMQESTVTDGKFEIIRTDKSFPDREYFLKTTQYLREKYGYTEYRGDAVEFHESGMVTFPLIGTKALIEDKLAFDPDRSKRRAMYGEVCELFPDYSVYIGGTSSFDFSAKKYNKYDAIMTYAAAHGYEKDEILYVGDDFAEGGGDSHVRIYGMDYVEIDDYRKTAEKLAYLL
ncbi:MAG: HAD family hydrolase [Clostridia bacterium]|nr:HAD family hydrolase [Clostridia bacterium]